MSTVIKDKDGKVIETVQDTQYHRDGTGARDSKGNLLDRPAAATKPAGKAAPAKSETK
ncbi:MAG: hypothetical protein MK141_14275 [Pseudoxanthomonas sp.]|uniref:hypothetical protein n=1 Tax=Pseudoxanthomonas sp. TaxID=1871049 RepID=UPI002590C7CA|nr:hypothetical protein [Pseudoxanthomonas sp.]MCH2092726.1 hypothetical protein [Pseudoxanthomonas sp.]